MPSPATMSAGAGASPGNNQAKTVAVTPFVRASAEHREGAFIDISKPLLATGSQDQGTFDIPAYGYIRNLVLVVSATAATGGTLQEDGPWSVLQNLAFTEPNGAVIAQFNSGYDAFLANKWGGYRHPLGTDLRAAPSYLQDAVGNFNFLLRIPIEISAREALGSLPNQNAAASFKFRYTLASGAAGGPLYSAITLQPTVRVRFYLEAWDQPELQSSGGANQVTPPAMNTTQFWTPQIINVSAGQQTIKLTRVGNYIRSLILQYRRTGTSRSLGEADFPDPMTLFLDARPIDIVEKNNFLHQMYERTGYGGRAAGGALTAALAGDVAGGLDNGIRVYDFCHEFDQGMGRETRDLWLPTLSSTRLEIQGSFANAGVLTVLTNDVAIAGPVFI